MGGRYQWQVDPHRGQISVATASGPVPSVLCSCRGEYIPPLQLQGVIVGTRRCLGRLFTSYVCDTSTQCNIATRHVG